eukprot:1824831-Amphidinium_carterae.1
MPHLLGSVGPDCQPVSSSTPPLILFCTWDTNIIDSLHTLLYHASGLYNSLILGQTGGHVYHRTVATQCRQLDEMAAMQCLMLSMGTHSCFPAAGPLRWGP